MIAPPRRFHTRASLVILQDHVRLPRGQQYQGMSALGHSTRVVKSVLLRRNGSSMATENLRQQKDALRKAIRANLAKLSSEEIEHQCLFSP